MSTEPLGNAVQFEVELQFQGAGDEQPPETSVFVYDANGQFVASSAVQDSRAVLNLPARLNGQTIRVFAGPRRQASETPSVADLTWQQAYEWREPLAADNPRLRLVIVEPIWRPWFFCPCVVTGQLVTTQSLPDGTTKQLPICNSRVHICEVIPFRLILDRLPDPVVLQLRDAVLDIARRPMPLATASPAGDAAQRENSALSGAAAIGQDKLLPLSLSPSVVDIKARLAELGPIILPWFCYWPWIEPWLLVNCFETVTTDENGKFAAIIWYPCGSRPNLYFSAEQLQGSLWVPIYQPPVRCWTYWDFACGSNVVLNVTDPAAIACAPASPVVPPEGTKTWVMPTAVGGSTIWGTHPVTPAPTGSVKGDGLVDYKATDGRSLVDAPFGSYLGLRSGSSTDIPSPSLYYYRWSYRAGTSGGFAALTIPVSKHYIKQLPPPTNQVSYPAYQLGPNTVGAEQDLFQFKPVNPPGPTPSDPAGTKTSWPTDDIWADIYSGYWDTTLIPAGEYQVKLEVFDEAGNLVDPATGAFTFIVPSGVGSDGVTILTRVANPNPIAAGGEIDGGGFVFNLHIDNNSCTASIDKAMVGGSQANDCGFLGYSDASTSVTLAFHAKHPNNFAVFDWVMTRGLTGLPAFDVTDAEVAATTAGTYSGDGAGDFSDNPQVSSLVGECANAAFSEELYVAAKATNGWGVRLSQYDAQQNGAFALQKDLILE